MIPNESINKTISKTKNFTPIELVRPTILLNILVDLMFIFYHPLLGYATEFLDAVHHLGDITSAAGRITPRP